MVDGEQHEEAELRHACSLLATIGHAVSRQLCTVETKVEREGTDKSGDEDELSPSTKVNMWVP